MVSRDVWPERANQQNIRVCLGLSGCETRGSQFELTSSCRRHRLKHERHDDGSIRASCVSLPLGCQAEFVGEEWGAFL